MPVYIPQCKCGSPIAIPRLSHATRIYQILVVTYGQPRRGQLQYLMLRLAVDGGVVGVPDEPKLPVEPVQAPFDLVLEDQRLPLFGQQWISMGERASRFDPDS